MDKYNKPKRNNYKATDFKIFGMTLILLSGVIAITIAACLLGVMDCRCNKAKPEQVSHSEYYPDMAQNYYQDIEYK